MAKVQQHRVTSPQARAGPQRSTARSPRHDHRRAGWLKWIPALIALATIAGVLVARQALPALGGEGGKLDPRPIATLTSPDIHSLLVDPTNPDHVLFGSHAGIQESRDGGFTWRAGTLQNADAMSLAASPRDPDTLYVAGHDVFLVSRDGGQTWQPVAHDLPGTDLHAFAQDASDPRRLYALVVGFGIMTSADGGATWVPLPTQPPGVSGHGALATDGATLYAVTAVGLVRSTDGGKNWERTPEQPSEMVLSLAMPAGTLQTLYAGSESGIAKSTDGGASWVALGPVHIPVLALAVAPSDPNRVFIVDDAGAVYRSDDGGASWTAPR